MSPNSLRSDCRKFAPNIFNKTKCTNCFKQKEEHSAEALECNRVSEVWLTPRLSYSRHIPIYLVSGLTCLTYLFSTYHVFFRQYHRNYLAALHLTSLIIHVPSLRAKKKHQNITSQKVTVISTKIFRFLSLPALFVAEDLMFIFTNCKIYKIKMSF